MPLHDPNSDNSFRKTLRTPTKASVLRGDLDSLFQDTVRRIVADSYRPWACDVGFSEPRSDHERWNRVAGRWRGLLGEILTSTRRPVTTAVRPIIEELLTCSPGVVTDGYGKRSSLCGRSRDCPFCFARRAASYLEPICEIVRDYHRPVRIQPYSAPATEARTIWKKIDDCVGTVVAATPRSGFCHYLAVIAFGTKKRLPPETVADRLVSTFRFPYSLVDPRPLIEALGDPEAHRSRTFLTFGLCRSAAVRAGLDADTSEDPEDD